MAEQRSRRWWLAGGVVVVLAVVGTGAGLWVSDASGDAGYRTTAATTADVRQTLDVTGTASPVHRSTAAFQVAGTVAAVDVTVGQTVTAGQVLASLG
ncbi:MAG TPA: biotin/lipoyl-binding protein, partial [Acidimicrobiales bacterium]|nr:biotin/lipoyl-binding protein [Acidimicrobiales bacterium]